MPKIVKTICLNLKRLKYIFIFAFIATTASVCTTTSIIAGSGLLSSVGGVTFIQGANQFWVSQSQPIFSGITDAGGSVDVTIGATKNGVVADSSGNWSYTSPTALSGDNQVTVATANASVSFTLTIGALPESIASASGSTLAPAGSVDPTLFILGGGISLMIIGAFGLRRT